MVPLADGASVENTLKNLRWVAQEAGNVAGTSAGRTPKEICGEYLRWAEEAERMLSYVLPPDDLTDAIHTQRYWSLRPTTGDEPRLTPTVLAELENRKRYFEGLAAELDAEGRRWSSEAAVIVVPDTNLFLNATAPLPTIDWHGALGVQADVRIAIPIVVIHELDRLKRQGNNTAQRGAREALRWLLKTLPKDPSARSTDESNGISIEVYVHDGPTRPTDADATIIEIARRLDAVSGMPTRLVTRDLGMRIRAAARGVEAIQLPEPEDDPKG